MENKILTEAKGLAEQMTHWRRTIHMQPEIGCDLPNTTKFIMHELMDMGYSPYEICKSGVCATAGMRNTGKTILLRADMDALPMCERSGEPFSSINNFAHTCGHDLHIAMLLGAAKLLKLNEGKLEGKVKIIFQPDEEGLTGANAMIEAGILDDPKVDAAMAMHVIPRLEPAGAVAFGVGPMASSSDRFHIRITGRSGHGSSPHNAIDPINAAVHIHLALQTINSREADPQQPLVITVCSLHAGDAPNAIPDTAELTGTIRAFNENIRNMAKQRLKEIAESTAHSFRCICSVTFLGSTPPCVNDDMLTHELIEYVTEIAPVLIPAPPTMGSEDFAQIAARVPSTYFMIAAGGLDKKYKAASQHQPEVVFNEEVLPYGAAYFVSCAHHWLAKHRE